MAFLFKALGVEVYGTQMTLVFGLILVRQLAMISILPYLFSNPVPNVARVGVAFLLSAVIYPSVYPHVPDGLFENHLLTMLLFGKELFYGLAIGIMGGIVFYAFEAAGMVIDNQRGASMAQIFSPETGQQVTVFGKFIYQLAVVLFLTIGGHRLFLHAFYNSYISLPVYEMPAMGAGLFEMINLFLVVTGKVLLIAAQLTLPILISIFLVDIVLGLINRISPAVNVLTLGFSIRGVMGVIILFVVITVLMHEMKLISMESIKYVRQTIFYLAGGT
jgi:type III secretion protein SpaR/YscT/HrcT